MGSGIYGGICSKRKHGAWTILLFVRTESEKDIDAGRENPHL